METKLTKFYRPNDINIEEFETIVNNMRIDLKQLCEGAYDEVTTKKYVKELIEEARPIQSRQDVLCWGLDEPENMPSDARVDFFYIPSYLACAFIIRAVLNYPDLLKEDDFSSKFTKALRGTTLRNFAGHGYDNDKGRVEAMHILASSGASEFIERYPSICPIFNEKYLKTIAKIKDLIVSSHAKTVWGDDYSLKAKEVISMDSCSYYKNYNCE